MKPGKKGDSHLETGIKGAAAGLQHACSAQRTQWKVHLSWLARAEPNPSSPFPFSEVAECSHIVKMIRTCAARGKGDLYLPKFDVPGNDDINWESQ